MKIILTLFLILGLTACGSTLDIDENTDASGTSPAGQDAPMDTDLSGENTLPDDLPDPQIADETDAIVPTGPLNLRTATGERVVIELFSERQLIDAPFSISGYVPADWVFEGSFPITLMTDTGDIIAEAPGEADWIDDSGNPIVGPVYYTVIIDFVAPSDTDEGKLRLGKAIVGDDTEEEYVETLVLWSK